jgi:hypothetical protein
VEQIEAALCALKIINTRTGEFPFSPPTQHGVNAENAAHSSESMAHLETEHNFPTNNGRFATMGIGGTIENQRPGLTPSLCSSSTTMKIFDGFCPQCDEVQPAFR